jgi:hypothetical protein
LHHVRNFSHSRLSLLLALLATFAVTLAWLPQPAMAAAPPAWLPQPAMATASPVWLPQPTAMAGCTDAVRESFYSDATYTTKVGECHHECCQQQYTCTGEVTLYGLVDRRWSCSFE